MRIQGLAAVGVVVALVLAGCGSGGVHPFIDEKQATEDVLPPDIVEQGELDPATVRLQGSWNDQQIFLALGADEQLNEVRLVIVPEGEDADSWVIGGSSGGGEVSVTGPSGTEATYRPSGAGDPPEGWTALSEWVVVRG